MSNYTDIVDALLMAPRTCRTAEQLFSYAHQIFPNTTEVQIRSARTAAIAKLKEHKKHRELEVRRSREESERELAQLDHDIWLLSEWTFAQGKVVRHEEFETVDDDIPF
jgi:hypothetical protein